MTVILGIHNTPKLVNIHPMEFFVRKLVGCIFGDFKGKTQLPDLADKCMKGVIRLLKCLSSKLYHSFTVSLIAYCSAQVVLVYAFYIYHISLIYSFVNNYCNQSSKFLQTDAGAQHRCIYHARAALL